MSKTIRFLMSLVNDLFIAVLAAGMIRLGSPLFLGEMICPINREIVSSLLASLSVTSGFLFVLCNSFWILQNSKRVADKLKIVKIVICSITMCLSAAALYAASMTCYVMFASLETADNFGMIVASSFIFTTMRALREVHGFRFYEPVRPLFKHRRRKRKNESMSHIEGSDQ